MAKRRQTRKRVKKVKGGFYPSVYGGVTLASYITPLALRQGIQLIRNNKTRKQKRKQTKKHK
jgi:hypothetical protein